jgi:hypothetical protein
MGLRNSPKHSEPDARRRPRRLTGEAAGEASASHSVMAGAEVDLSGLRAGFRALAAAFSLPNRSCLGPLQSNPVRSRTLRWPAPGPDTKIISKWFTRRTVLSLFTCFAFCILRVNRRKR